MRHHRFRGDRASRAREEETQARGVHVPRGCFLCGSRGGVYSRRLEAASISKLSGASGGVVKACSRSVTGTWFPVTVWYLAEREEEGKDVPKF